MACTVDCLDNYGCGTPNQVFPGAVYAPFVELNLGGQKITVGNNSAAPDNHATISSFEYGFEPGSVGYGATFELIDQGGVMYRRIIRAINKTASLAMSDTESISFDFGWIVKHCDGTVDLQSATKTTGKTYHGMITKVEQTFEGGKIKIKFKLEAPGTGTTPNIRHDDTAGDEGQKITLKQALTSLFTEHHPKFKTVKFINKDGGELEFKNSDGGELGPKGAWPMNQQTPLSAARTWLNSVTTNNNRGILICYDQNESAIVFQEDKLDRSRCCVASRGTYIVNGGNCSPVLEFNPTINWNIGTIPSAGAATGSGASGDNTNYVRPTKNIQEVGTQTSPAIQQHDWLWRHPDALSSGAAEGTSAQLEANENIEILPGFSAQLKIHGDPSFADPLALIGETISIIVINPFHINKECVWITQPNCNSILSNKNYNIHGVSHQITGGSFVTTLTVFLAQPNKDIDADSPLGGCGTERFNDAIGGSQATDANE